MRLRIRTLDGEIAELGVAGGRWVSPDLADEASGSHDLTDGWAVTGLVDAHAHLSSAPGSMDAPDLEQIRRRALAAVQAGVVLCLDKGYSDNTVLRLLNDPPDTRPVIQAAGRIIAAPGGYFEGFALEVDDGGLVEAVIAQAGQPGGWVKLVGDWPKKGIGPGVNFDVGALREAVGAAHELGARVAIHTMAGAASLAVEAGVDSIEHGLFLTPDDVAALAERGGMWVPTILRMEQVLEGLRAGSSGAVLLGRGLENVRRLLPVAAETGLTVLPGSDLAVEVAAVAGELERMVAYGFPADRAVMLATEGIHHLVGDLGGDLAGGASNDTGDLARSMFGPADLVVYALDPRRAPATLHQPVFVMRAGVLITNRVHHGNLRFPRKSRHIADS